MWSTARLGHLAVLAFAAACGLDCGGRDRSAQDAATVIDGATGDAAAAADGSLDAPPDGALFDASGGNALRQERDLSRVGRRRQLVRDPTPFDA